MIHSTFGNLFSSDAEALVNAVNCVGVMGAGIAQQFKINFPAMFDEYQRLSLAGYIKPGHIHAWRGWAVWVLNFPTKRHWKDHSRMADIESGLVSLLETVQENKIKSLAMPKIGCGLGGLDWSAVRPKIETTFAPHPEIEIYLYE